MSVKFPTKYLIPTHNELRNRSIIPLLMDTKHSVHKNAFNNPRETLQIIRIKKKNDVFINNGHHRLVAAHNLWGYIPDDHLEIKEYTLEDFLEINTKVGWVTPYNPYTHCRKREFWSYKKEVLDLSKYMSTEELDKFINSHKYLYLEDRRVYNLGDLYG